MLGIPFLTEENFWLVRIFIGLFSLGVGLIVLRYILRFLRNKAKKGKNEWAKHLESVVFRPARLLIWVLSIAYILTALANQAGLAKNLNYIKSLRNGLCVASVTWFLLLWKNEIQHYLIKKGQGKKLTWDRHSLDFLGKIATLVILFISFLTILDLFGRNIMPLIAFGGIGAAAIGFAAKDVIANFFGGLMIYITRPYSLGDYVELPKEKLYGQIEAIGWYMTCIRNVDKVPVYIPNALFSTALIMNSSRRTHRKIEETISISYGDFPKILPILEKIRGYLDSNEKVDSSQPMMVYFSSLATYSLDIFVRAYLSTTSYTEYFAIKEEVLIEIKKIIIESGASMPFPTTTVHVESV